ncbi:MAG: hypothetical protein ACREI5_09420 [Candidatus Methylomirabilales bacterium]
MSFIADLHLHSRYSRATSREMEVESLARWARRKGIALLGTGDLPHPTYFAELQAKLTSAEPGLYRLKKEGQAILRVREGLVMIVPGYDGVYGTIKVLGDELAEIPSPWQPEQMHLL